ncbi:phage tail tape measure C-terminal domain-containing protein [Primorskyibacter sp. S87]|uniref:phage tail tape measure C-terminal domain-containing protein n=1 Tax=Primorskyibacter sp. S87 TaxID=3415126 RepID=UPI003C7A2E4E
MVERIQTQHEMILSVEAEKMVRDLQRAEKELADLAVGFDRAQAAGKRFGKQTANLNRSLSANQRLMQQGSVQFGDFLVQIGGGQNALLAFSQQANQLSSFMAGPWGIAFTVATGVLAAFGMKLFEGSEETKAFEKSMQDAAEASKNLADQIERTAKGIDTTQQRLGRDIAAAQLELNNALEAYNEGLAEGDDALWSQVEAAEAKVQRAEEELAKYEELLARQKDQNAEMERAKNLGKELADAERLVGEQMMNAARAAAVLTWETQQARDAAMEAAREWAIMQGLRSRFADEDSLMSQPVVGKPGKGPSTSTKSGGGRSSIDRAEEQLAKFNEQLARTVDLSDRMATGLGDVMANSVDTFVDSLAQGEFAFRDFARSVLQDIAKMTLRALILHAIMRALGMNVGNPQSMFGLAFQQGLGIPINPNLDPSSLTPFAKGGVVNGATPFPMSGGGVGVMGERGPEAIVPLQAHNGVLGVAASPVTIHNYSGQPARVEDRGGERHVIIGEAVMAAEASIANQLVLGQGPVARAMESGYGSRRKAV